MFDIGMTELLLIGIVALIVIGPKDLPGLFHTLGRFTAKARALGREFTRAMNDAARESGVDDVASSLKGMGNPKKFGLDKLNEAADRFENWDPSAAVTKPAPAAKPTDPERAADVEKIRAATEKAGKARLAREKAKAENAVTEAAPSATKAAAKAPQKTPAEKEPAVKRAPAKVAGEAAKAARKTPAKGAAKPRKTDRAETE